MAYQTLCMAILPSKITTKLMLLMLTQLKITFVPVLIGDDWRVILRENEGDYINAVFVNVCIIILYRFNFSQLQGYKQRRAFIIAQSPMESTARDFWKMIYDRKCGVIVMLCDLVEDGEVISS